MVSGPQQASRSSSHRRCCRRRTGDFAQSQHLHQRRLVRRYSVSGAGCHAARRRDSGLRQFYGNHNGQSNLPLQHPATLEYPGEPVTGTRLGLHVALAQRARDYHQQRLSRRNADDDAGRFPRIRDRRNQLGKENNMRFNSLKATLKTAVLGAAVLLSGAGVARAQQQINLIAQPTNAVMPDGSTVPMWGYSCGAAVTSLATCAPLNKNAGGAFPATATLPAVPGWSPVVITIPTGATGGLTINLTNNLTFANGNTVPTSLMIVGQVGGGLGGLPT